LILNTENQEGDGLMIRFQCKNCGQKIKVQENLAGKKGKCPKCKNIVIVPTLQDSIPSTSQKDISDVKVNSEKSPYDLSLLDIPPKDESPSQPTKQDEISNESFEETPWYGASYKKDEAERTGKRKLPWIIDIFIYPISKAGLTTLGIIIGIQLLLTLIVKLFGVLALAFPPFLVFLALFAVCGFLIKIFLLLYFYWYFCVCIQDSALGGIRTPETIGITPGLGEIFWQLVRAVVCLCVFLAPAIIYFRHTGNKDLIFWSLLGYAVFFFPMGLLAIIIFDSFNGLNPKVLFGSILSTLLPYCGLVLFYYALCYVPFLIITFLPKGILLRSRILLLLFQIISMYFILISGHLLGRFFWRYQEKLNWEV